jgi:DNA-binding CsgD family transcriptional regulator
MLVGRKVETDQISQLLSAARNGSAGVLVFRGDAGVGKSALLEHAADEADGFIVLHCTGVESESELAYAALHQILRPVLDRIERLPAPQAAALEAAFALSDETVGERFRVSLGVLGLLSEVAEERPVLCLVDDAQWLDQASTDALMFAARRLEGEPIVLLFAARDDDQRPFEAAAVPDVRLALLDRTESRALLSGRLGAGVAPAVVDWLVDNADGNPLALVELPAALTGPQLKGNDPLAGVVAPPTTVEQVYLQRIRSLPDATNRLLLLAAAEDAGARATVEGAAGASGLDITDLGPAEALGLVRVDGDVFAFRHPMVRTAIYRGATFHERENAHRLLAEAAAAEKNPDRAAWHRAAATVGVDEEVAAALEATAERARSRSGYAAAASALERAADLTPDPATRARRLVAAASAAWPAGQPDRATALLDRAAPITTDPRLVAESSCLRGVMAWRCGSLFDSCSTLMTAAAQLAPIDADLAVGALADAGVASWDSGDFRRLDQISLAIAALPPLDGAENRLLAEVMTGAVSISQGGIPDDFDVDGFARTVASALRFDDSRLLVWAAIGAELLGHQELENQLLDRAATIARASGAVDELIVALESYAVQGFIAGNFSVSSEATEGVRLAVEAGLPNAASLHRAALSWLAAVRGDESECRELARTVTLAARPNGQGIANSIAEWAVALLDLGLGRPDDTVERLVVLSAAPAGVSHPFYIVSSAPDLIEACVRTGRVEMAVTAYQSLRPFESDGAPFAARALAARCRALMAEGEEAERLYAEALKLHSEHTNPFDRARTELVYGEFLRREKRRTDARVHLRAALSAFEQLRAEPWAERAGNELRASGETARRRDATTSEDLTPQELQIARLVAEGQSNKEVAARLFLSPRTVEYHLRKVFAKLGIASRADLIRNGVDDRATAPA